MVEDGGGDPVAVGVGLDVGVAVGEPVAVLVADGVAEALGDPDAEPVDDGVGELSPSSRHTPRTLSSHVGEGLGVGQFDGEGLPDPLGEGQPCCASAMRP